MLADTVKIQMPWDEVPAVETTELRMGNGYVGATQPMPGYATGLNPAHPFDCSQIDMGYDPRCAPSASKWIEQNKTAVYVGAGILVLMAMLGRRR